MLAKPGKKGFGYFYSGLDGVISTVAFKTDHKKGGDVWKNYSRSKWPACTDSKGFIGTIAQDVLLDVHINVNDKHECG